MNCRRMQDLIPLFIEGDLKEGQAGPVRSHLEGCPECAQIASEYRASQQWLKAYTPPDFEEDFFDGLRRDVHREIGAGSSRASRFNRLLALNPASWNPASFALASVAVFGLFVGLTVYAYLNMSGGLSSHEIPPYLLGGTSPTGVPGLDAGAPSDIDWKLREANRRAGRTRNRRPEPAAPLTIEAEPARAVLRIELQTGDPNIRIIWFAPGEANAGNSKMIISVETE
jgi:hypothetical protein